MKTDITLDLHGVRHEDVKPEVVRFVEKNWNSGVKGTIVTGHSIRMKVLVSEVLDEYKLVYKTFQANYPKIDTIFE